jgi:hypothetical protein
MLHGLLVQIEGQCGEFGGVMCVRVCTRGRVEPSARCNKMDERRWKRENK